MVTPLYNKQYACGKKYVLRNILLWCFLSRQDKLSRTMYRSRKTVKAYHKKGSGRPTGSSEEQCPYCHLDDRPILVDGSTMRIFPNKFPYEYWDNRGVVEHLLLVPKRHVESVDHLTDVEKAEAINLMADYEAAGYSVYWRNQANTARSVPHQHTHLLKLNNESPNFVFYLKKPYLVWRG